MIVDLAVDEISVNSAESLSDTANETMALLLPPGWLFGAARTARKKYNSFWCGASGLQQLLR